jgi:hypothetical protein
MAIVPYSNGHLPSKTCTSPRPSLACPYFVAEKMQKKMQKKIHIYLRYAHTQFVLEPK